MSRTVRCLKNDSGARRGTNSVRDCGRAVGVPQSRGFSLKMNPACSLRPWQDYSSKSFGEKRRELGQFGLDVEPGNVLHDIDGTRDFALATEGNRGI